MEQYKKYFQSPLFECTDCKACSKKSFCFKENLAVKCDKMKEATRKFNEACPAGAKPRNGGCANAKNDGYLKGVCDLNYSWDAAAGSTGKCVHNTDDKKHQSRSER